MDTIDICDAIQYLAFKKMITTEILVVMRQILGNDAPLKAGFCRWFVCF